MVYKNLLQETKRLQWIGMSGKAALKTNVATGYIQGFD